MPWAGFVLGDESLSGIQLTAVGAVWVAAAALVIVAFGVARARQERNAKRLADRLKQAGLS